MSKLHEILAVENGLGETANRVAKETTKTLADKRTIFSGLIKKHEINREELEHLQQVDEVVEVQSTVNEQLNFLGEHLANYWDVILQKESANQSATADIIINGNTIASNVPAIVLLGMEKKLSSLLATYNAIPTLDASQAWDESPESSKPGIYRVKHPRETMQAVVEKEWKEISPATDKHPAQLKEIEKRDVIGKYTITAFSGAITSYDKAEKLERLTTLIRAVKKARMRANDVEVNTDLKFGKALLDYVNG